jgi:CCR4-NOT transcriptional regulation complex NOT5 subunit
MSKTIGLDDDLVAGMIRSQICSWQDLLYSIENDVFDREYLLENVRTIGRKSGQLKSLERALLNSA